MNRKLIHLALGAAILALCPAAVVGEPPAQTTDAPKKKSSLFGFAKRVMEQVAPQVLPQDGSLKAVAGQVALSAVEQAGEGEASPSATNACGLDAASMAAMTAHGQGGSAAPNAEARAALGQLATMMKSRGDRASTAAANVMLGGKPTC
jgi:hypothetical protein